MQQAATKKPRVPNAGSFQPGDTRINRGGRPRTGMALAETIRERLDPTRIADLLDSYLADASVPTERKLSVLLPWCHAGYLKPPTGLVVAGENVADGRDWSAVPLEKRRELLAAMDAALESAPMADADTNSPGLDGNQVAMPAIVEGSPEQTQPLACTTNGLENRRAEGDAA